MTQPNMVLVAYGLPSCLLLISFGSSTSGTSHPISKPTSPSIWSIWMLDKCGHLFISCWVARFIVVTGNSGVENTVFTEIWFSPLKSESSKLIIELSVMLFAFSSVVSDRVVFFPSILSCLIRFCEQKEVLDPPSRNVYVWTIFSLPNALTFTATNDRPIS